MLKKQLDQAKRVRKAAREAHVAEVVAQRHPTPENLGAFGRAIAVYQRASVNSGEMARTLAGLDIMVSRHAARKVRRQWR